MNRSVVPSVSLPLLTVSPLNACLSLDCYDQAQYQQWLIPAPCPRCPFVFFSYVPQSSTLHFNDLTTLPSGIFDSLAKLTEL